MENQEELPDLANKILTKDDLCRIMKVKRNTINYLTFSRQLPYFKVGKECRYWRKDVLEFIEKRMQRPGFRYIDPHRPGRIQG